MGATPGPDDAFAEPGPARDLWTAAAVRESFRPEALLEAWLLRRPDAARDDRRRAMSATLDLQTDSVPVENADGTDAWQLPTGLRLHVLGIVGPASIREALAHGDVPAMTLVDRVFESLLLGDKVRTDTKDRLHLVALKTAALWASAAGSELPFDPVDITRALNRLDFLQTLGGSDLDRFIGRRALRDHLGEMWQSAKPPPVLVEGPGGIGKSIAISRFISDCLDSDDPSLRPDAVFHIDFDRLALQSARLSTIMLDIVRQTARWWTADDAAGLLDVVQQASSGDVGLESAITVTRSSEAGFNEFSVAQQIMSLLPENARIILFVDSFEQVDGYDDVAVQSVVEAAAVLAFAGAKVFTIYASRAFALPWRLSDAAPIRLQEFSPGEAEAYLVNEAARSGLYVERSVAQQVWEAIGRAPLALRIAVGLLEKDRAAFRPETWSDLARSSPELVQAALYERVLDRVRNKELLKVAKPGLLVRRLTREVISEVLAGPCDLDLTATSAGKLMRTAKSERQLFVLDPLDPGAVRHRQDVRATMMSNLDAVIAPDLAREINEAAVAYYVRHGTNALYRTEELYHRLRLGVIDGETSDIDARWTEEAGRPLRVVIREFPPASRSYLRIKLGAASLEEAAAPQGGQGAAAAGTVPGRLTSQQAAEHRLIFLKRLQSGESGSTIEDDLRTLGLNRLDGQLGDIYCNLLVQQGRFEDLTSGATLLLDRLKTSTLLVEQGRFGDLTGGTSLLPGRLEASTMEPQVAAGVFASAAAYLEGTPLVAQAHTFWVAASGAMQGVADLAASLAIAIGLLRTRRKLGLDDKERMPAIQAALEDAAVDWRIFDQRVLLREAAAELSEVLIGDGDDKARDTAFRLVRMSLSANEAFPSAADSQERLSALRTSLADTPSVQTVHDLNSAVERRLYGGGNAAVQIVAALREEVDWTLARPLARFMLSLGQRRTDAKQLLEAILQDNSLGSADPVPARTPGLIGAEASNRDPLRQAVDASAAKLRTGDDLTGDEQFSLEAVVLPSLRPVIDIIGGDYHVTQPLWQHLNDASIKVRLRKTLASVGRIELPSQYGLPYGGTGFVVGRDLLMTTRHVAQIFCSGLGVSNLVFHGHGTGVNFARERNSPADEAIIQVQSVAMIHPYWDMALLRVEGLDPDHPPLVLSLTWPEDLDGRDIVVIGYPAFDPRWPADVQNHVFGGAYSFKRLQPGKMKGRDTVTSFGNSVSAAVHDSSTLGGNAGSPVIDIMTGEVVGLRFSSVYLKGSYAVPTAEFARDPHVIAMGLNFAEPPKPEPDIASQWWQGVGG